MFPNLKMMSDRHSQHAIALTGIRTKDEFVAAGSVPLKAADGDWQMGGLHFR